MKTMTSSSFASVSTVERLAVIKRVTRTGTRALSSFSSAFMRVNSSEWASRRTRIAGGRLDTHFIPPQLDILILLSGGCVRGGDRIGE